MCSHMNQRQVGITLIVLSLILIIFSKSIQKLNSWMHDRDPIYIVTFRSHVESGIYRLVLIICGLILGLFGILLVG